MKKLIGLKVKQWRKDWNQVKWDVASRRSEPQHWFYQFSIKASLLREWSGVNVRNSAQRAQGRDDLGIQRRHEGSRSEEIGRYVEFGYPWSELSEAKRNDPEYDDLRKPGWLPTAIVVNILTAKDSRNGRKVSRNDLIKIQDREDGLAELVLPPGQKDGSWTFSDLPPVEVIDGQHRLWAFSPDADNDFELPVVAFVGLDLSWQAYLFYTVNIKPKKINASLAFDLYPLLRSEDWLEKFEGHIIYRETRAQEIVDLLWSHPSSPWHKRINMLGESGQRGKMVTQAAWIRALLATFVKSYEGPSVKLGGLFGAPTGQHKEVLPWSRREQAAFLIWVSSKLQSAIEASKSKWAQEIRKGADKASGIDSSDQAFFGENSLLSQDQGIRAFLHVINDCFYLNAEAFDLHDAFDDADEEESDIKTVTSAIKCLSRRKPLGNFLEGLCSKLATYDWRAMSAPGLSDEDKSLKSGFRGSGGYKQLRLSILRHLLSDKGDIGSDAKQILAQLGG